MQTSTLDRTLSLPDLAKCWGWSQDKLYRLCQAEAIPHLRIRGRIYFELSAVEAWKAAARRADTRQEARQEASARSRRRTRDEECARLGIPVNHEFA